MKKKLTRLFSVLLAAVLVFGTLPISAMGTDVADPPASAADESAVESLVDESSAVDDAAQPEEQSAEDEGIAVQATEPVDGYDMNVFFLDCGRKYYSVNTIKSFIDTASGNGFNYIQLAVGNDGLRFLLDDMSLTVNGTTYSSKQVSAAIHAGNESYYDFTVDELTQDEMDTIIAYAAECGMGVIPCVNTPGHMDAILSAASSLTGVNCAYSGSVRTIDVTNSTAVAFTQALLQKYIDYFVSKDCKYFNMGADEYANDIYTTGSMGFGNLQGAGKYGSYVTYVNQVAALIKNAGMTPMAFNDGIYFNNNTSSGTFDTDIVVCYWSSGWNGYTPMPAEKLAGMGFKLVNTNGSYYWVLGKSDAQCSAEKAAGFDYTAFAGGTVNSPKGSMFCIWADYPGAETEEDVFTKTEATIQKFGRTLLAAGIPGQPEVRIQDNLNGGKLTVGGDMTLRANKKVDWTTSNAEVAAIASADEVSTYSNGDTVNAQAITVTAGKAGAAQITATSGDKVATYDVTVAEKETKTIVIGVGKTSDPITVDGDWTDADTSALDGKIANVAMEHDDSSGGTVYNPVTTDPLAAGEYYISANPDDSAPTMQVSIEVDNNNYYVKFNGRYWYPTIDWNYGGYQYTATSQQQKNNSTSVKIAKNGNGYYISKTAGYYNSYLMISGNTFSGNNKETPIYFYTQGTADAKKQTKITFKGNAVGETSVTIGGVVYTIKVVSAEVANADPLTIEYWITNAKVSAEGVQSKALHAAEDGVYSEQGTEIANLVPSTGSKVDGGYPVKYLKAVRLASNNKQTTDNGVDKTTSGEEFTYVRYWNSTWSFSADRETWNAIDKTDQIVAYYLQKTEVTSEVTTYVTDWGYTYGDWKNNRDDAAWFWRDYVEGSGDSHNFVFMDFAVVYEDGTQNPQSFPVNNTQFFHADSVPRKIGYINFSDNDDFEIWKVTVTDGKASAWSSATSFASSYDNATETTVWDESMGGEPHIDQINYTAKRTGKLIRVYVRAKVTEDSLTVNYIDDGNGQTFYSYNIAVKSGTLFDPNFAIDGTHNVVKNIKDINQTVTNDLSVMTEIGAQYRYAEYTYVRHDLEEGQKVVNLHYNFTRTAKFVVDFGTSVKIKPSDIKDTLKNANITNVVVSGANHGSTTVDKDHNVIFTPNSEFVKEQNGESLQITYKGTKVTEDGASKDGEITYTVYIYPASNVLYEENFLTKADGWTDTQTGKHSDAQETQKAKEAKSVFGYDDTYTKNEVTGENGAWKISELVPKKLYNPLTTEFYGNTFDLIGNCGPTTGRVMIVFKNQDGKYAAIVDIDTRYNGGNIYQVPLAHITLGDGTDANYSVSVYASGLAATGTATTPNAVATMSLDDATVENDELLAQILEENDLTLDEVEYTSISAMDTVSAMDVPDDGVATYAADTGVEHQRGDHVEINGFRVYRSTASTDAVAQNYPENEQNITYKNIIKVVDKTIIAYTEGDPEKEISVKQYEAAGGPQNEIYLGEKQSVSFGIEGVDQIQVSLRAVDKTTSWNTIEISSNTEMYYDLSVDEKGLFTITNTGSSLLAIGNVKVPDNSGAVTTASDIDYDTLLASIKASYGAGADEPAEVFTPETFTAKTTSTKVIRNKVVTLKVNVSSDVAYVTVNGVKYTRTGLQSMFQKTRTIRVVNTVPKNQTKNYEVIAYNADGVASEAITVTG